MRNKKAKKKKNTYIAIGGALLIVALSILFIVLGMTGGFSKNDTATVDVPTETIEDILPGNIEEDGTLGKGILEHIAGAALAVEDAWAIRPPMVELNDSNRSNFVSIDECIIDTASGKVKITGSSDGIPKSDDKYYYLFALKAYEDDISEGDEYIYKTLKNDETILNCSLNGNSSTSRLYQKFAVAVKLDGEYVMISRPSYITNPEAIAKYSNVYMKPSSKKGILVDYTKYKSGQLEDLGVAQVAVNFIVEDFLGPSSNAMFPTIHYTYNGKTYMFNGAALSGFDETIRYLTSKNISVTAILLNKYTSSYISLVHPKARNLNKCPYYMFNAATDDGIEYLAAIGSFFADRYSGNTHGRISNWVIANEINARKEWNYMEYTDVVSYTKEYADGFRILYNAIKSTSGSARVYISLDQQWDRNLSNNPDYDGRDVLDAFNAYIKEEGNIDWALAYHPYNVPLTTCSTWAASKYVKHSADSSMISMQNIEVLVNYMKQSQFLRADGSNRRIMITELGYTSSGSGGEAAQAAAIAYAFYKINYYDTIDGLLLNRQTDDPVEIAQGLATGITKLSGEKKKSYEVFKYMDTDQFESTCEFAKSIIGINKWSDIIY